MSISRNIKSQIQSMTKSKKTQRALLERAEELAPEKLNDEALSEMLHRHLEDNEKDTEK